MGGVALAEEGGRRREGREGGGRKEEHDTKRACEISLV